MSTNDEKEVNVSELLDCLQVLEEASGFEYEIRIKSSCCATLSKSNGNFVETVTTFAFGEPNNKPERSGVTLGNRMIAYMANLSKELLRQKISKIEAEKSKIDNSLRETKDLLKALGE